MPEDRVKELEREVGDVKAQTAVAGWAGAEEGLEADVGSEEGLKAAGNDVEVSGSLEETSEEEEGECGPSRGALFVARFSSTSKLTGSAADQEQALISQLLVASPHDISAQEHSEFVVRQFAARLRELQQANSSLRIANSESSIAIRKLRRL